MKKNCALLLCSAILLASCATYSDLLRKKLAGETTVAFYEYSLPETFAAVGYVLKKSENTCISDQYKACRLESSEEGDAIVARRALDGSVGFGVFLTRINATRTRADYVDAGFSGNLLPQCIIENTIDESVYLLKNGKKKYGEYTSRKAWEQAQKTWTRMGK